MNAEQIERYKMKRLILLVLILLGSVSICFAQDMDDLTDDQKKEYNRRKLTVERVTESSGGMGWYWSFFSKRVDTWRAFKGLANQIEAEEFFRITGYEEEADQVQTNLEAANSKITLGVVLYAGGLVASVMPKTETVNLDYYSYEEITYPYLIPGTIAWAGGLYLWYDGMMKKLKPVAPYETAADIADTFNKNLLKEITK